jgi:transcriptional regulator with XRE-family HTH domain
LQVLQSLQPSILKIIRIFAKTVQNIMSDYWSKKLGSIIKEYREANNLPLRKIAASLDLDQSTLSKIEKGERRGNIEMIPVVSRLFNLDYNGLQVDILSEKIIEENKEYPLLQEALVEALNKIKRAK